MKRFSHFTFVKKIIVLLTSCGLACSLLALFFIESNNESNKYVMIDDYILQHNENHSQQTTKDKVKEIKDNDIKVEKISTSSAAIIEPNQQEQTLETEPINTDSSSNKVNINTATLEQLQQLKGIGPSKAKAIIEEREKGGPFKTIEEIMRVKGIGEKTFERLKESLVN